MNPQQNKAKKPSPSTEASLLKQGILKLLSMLVVLFNLILPSMVIAAKITLAWNVNNPTPQGYHVYLRTEGQTYDYNTSTWSGTATTCTIDQLTDNIYYFELTVADTNELTASDTCQVTVLPVALTDSDNDRLPDTDETDLYGTAPNNPETDGDGITDGPEVNDGTVPTIPEAQYAKIWIEAEEGDIFAPMQIVTGTQDLSGECIGVPEVSSNYYDPSNIADYATYRFEAPVSSNYVVCGRIIANDDTIE